VLYASTDVVRDEMLVQVLYQCYMYWRTNYILYTWCISMHVFYVCTVIIDGVLLVDVYVYVYVYKYIYIYIYIYIYVYIHVYIYIYIYIYICMYIYMYIYGARDLLVQVL